MSRRVARRGLMKLLFQMDLNDDFSNESCELYLENEVFKEDEIDFIKSYTKAILENLSTIDSIISENLEGWTLNRVSNVDRQILRVAIYELNFTSTPSNIVINEAVEIAREYSSNESPKFVNGILGTIYRKSVKEG